MKKEEQVIDNKFGFAAFILGLFSLIFIWALFIPSIIMSFVGIIFAIIQLRKGKSKFAVAGLILCIISLVVAIYLAIKVVSFATGIYECSLNPASESCANFAAKLGIDANLIKCAMNMSAPGCEELINSQISLANT